MVAGFLGCLRRLSKPYWRILILYIRALHRVLTWLKMITRYIINLRSTKTMLRFEDFLYVSERSILNDIVRVEKAFYGFPIICRGPTDMRHIVCRALGLRHPGGAEGIVIGSHSHGGDLSVNWYICLSATRLCPSIQSRCPSILRTNSYPDFRTCGWRCSV